MKRIYILILGLAVTSLTTTVEARNLPSSNKKGNSTNTLAAGCNAATTATELALNNIAALIQTGGDMWWDFNQPRFEVPKGSGRHSMFAGDLWLGGQDVSGQLKVAAQMYRASGVDFWTGPLSTETAEIDAATCTQYDRHFVSTRNQVAEFVGWYEAGLSDASNGTSTQSENYPDYTPPSIIYDWPAHGRNYDPYYEDFNLAPFIDRNSDGVYNPEDGDYPGYDLKGEVDCSDRKLNIYGDENLWWIFNDKGNVHTETGAAAIGMEIRAQAFSFATNDEVNNMTFCNYELVNRSTFTLANTYFGVFADADLGGAEDDYVGCDVQRGLGFCYNGDDNDDDANGSTGYGTNPPCVGIDFFEGPYQDSDGIDNALGINYNEALNGVGYGDSIVDNERYGMRRFLWFNRPDLGADCCVDPVTGNDYYNYLRGIWRDNTKMVFGGNGHNTSGGIEADFMFPGDSDPLMWGTRGQDPGYPSAGGWTEANEGNSPADRRFVQSAGPFTLTPGSVNDITVGIVWARATSGGSLASVDAMKKADQKTQALFDACFRVLSGPDAPELKVEEYENKLVLFITNPKISNNYKEEYKERNAFIIPPDSTEILDENGDITGYYVLNDLDKIDYQSYVFEGYKIYQVKDKTVDASSLDDPDKARLIYQGDLKNNVTNLINWDFDSDLGITVPTLMVEGNNNGISHSLLVTEDQFATGNKTLVNHKTYYFMAIAYGYNNYKNYDPTDEDSQKTPYLPSRKAPTGAIKAYSGIPHNTGIENNGTILNSNYGEGVELTRIEGVGNGGNYLKMKQDDLDEALTNGFVANPTYEIDYGPVSIKVIDPLNVASDDFELKFTQGYTVNSNNDTIYTWGDLSDDTWMIYKKNATSSSDTIYSDRTIAIGYDQIILEWGLSVNVFDNGNAGNGDASNGLIGASVIYDDPSKKWLSGVSDDEGKATFDWIRSGTVVDDGDKENGMEDWVGLDNNSYYEGILDGTWAPFRLTSQDNYGPMPKFAGEIGGSQIIPDAKKFLDTDLGKVHSVDIFFTSDKEKWTRCPVLEAHYDTSNTVGTVKKGNMRASASVDKDGNPTTETTASDNPDDANYISATGMGWFPGYAIDIETGERLNMAFSENSWLKNENGNDMLWNPTQNLYEGPFNEPRGGGMHFIYVFRNNIVDEGTSKQWNYPTNRMPAYDAGKFMAEKLPIFKTGTDRDSTMIQVFKACMWVGYPLLAANEDLLSTDVKVELRVSNAYGTYGTQTALSDGESLTAGTSYIVNQGPVTYRGVTYTVGDTLKAMADDLTFTTSTYEKNDVLIPTVNEGLPMYGFSTKGLAPSIGETDVAISVLDEIKVVPNPYYGYSTYESDKLDTRVKVTNLPEKCTVTIYSINGTLIRQYKKDDPTITSIDWDLKNQANIPIAGGVYIFHVDAYELGEERIIKWFGAMRPADLDSF